MIKANECRILIDALHTDAVPPYTGSDMRLIRDVSVDYLIFTHMHRDHFDAALTVDYLERHRYTRVICGSDVQNALCLAGVDASRFVYGDKVCITSDIAVYRFSTRHIGAKYANTEHYSFIISTSPSLLIAGDASPILSNFSGVTADVAIVPFAYAMTVAAFRIIRDVIRPMAAVIVHLPEPSADPDGLNGQILCGIDTRGIDIYRPLIGETVIL
ncbi:MAG: MBL fold metallo-hydrolase [Clostridia bacterium]